MFEVLNLLLGIPNCLYQSVDLCLADEYKIEVY